MDNQPPDSPKTVLRRRSHCDHHASRALVELPRDLEYGTKRSAIDSMTTRIIRAWSDSDLKEHQPSQRTRLENLMESQADASLQNSPSNPKMEQSVDYRKSPALRF